MQGGPNAFCLLRLCVYFPESYPSLSHPVAELSAPWLYEDMRKRLVESLVKIYHESVGEVVVFRWVEWLKVLLISLRSSRLQGLNKETHCDLFICFMLFVSFLSRLCSSVQCAAVLIMGFLMSDKNSALFCSLGPGMDVERSRCLDAETYSTRSFAYSSFFCLWVLSAGLHHWPSLTAHILCHICFG